MWYTSGIMTESFPDQTAAGIDGLEQKMATTRTLVEALNGRQDLAGILISQLVEMAEDAEALAVDTAVSSVEAGRSSRRNAADRLRIHSHTLQRIIDERSQPE